MGLMKEMSITKSRGMNNKKAKRSLSRVWFGWMDLYVDVYFIMPVGWTVSRVWLGGCTQKRLIFYHTCWLDSE